MIKRAIHTYKVYKGKGAARMSFRVCGGWVVFGSF